MKELNYDSIIEQRINLSPFTNKQVEVSVLRLDRIHPYISGNKYFKLKYYLKDAIILGKRLIVTFGGPYSNHIVATAAACSLNGLDSIGIIRGEKPAELSHTLKFAASFGMKLFFSSREHYKTKTLSSEIVDYLSKKEVYIINEGGYGEKGMEGSKEILLYCQKEMYTHICCAVGTGTMLAGITAATSAEQHIMGISVLKNNHELENNVKKLLDAKPHKNTFEILDDYHFGGYAKYSRELILFINEFYELTQIPSDFVYTGKLIYGVLHLIEKDYFSTDSRILIIHSGGLQGNESLEPGTFMF